LKTGLVDSLRVVPQPISGSIGKPFVMIARGVEVEDVPVPEVDPLLVAISSIITRMSFRSPASILVPIVTNLDVQSPKLLASTESSHEASSGSLGQLLQYICRVLNALAVSSELSSVHETYLRYLHVDKLKKHHKPINQL
jgi:hypothetical protein